MSETLDDCDKFMRSLGAEVLALDVAKRAQLPDLPDRRYFYRGYAIWWEAKMGPNKILKTLGDKLSRGQLAFLEREYRYGCVAGAGDVHALRTVLFNHAQSGWRDAAWAEVGVLLLRGFRREKKPRSRTTKGRSP